MSCLAEARPSKNPGLVWVHSRVLHPTSTCDQALQNYSINEGKTTVWYWYWSIALSYLRNYSSVLGTVPPHDAACPTHDNDNILQGWHKLKKDLPISTRSIMWSHHLNLLIPSKHCKFLSLQCMHWPVVSCLLTSAITKKVVDWSMLLNVLIWWHSSTRSLKYMDQQLTRNPFVIHLSLPLDRCDVLILGK